MTKDMRSTAVRRVLRGSALVPAVVLIAATAPAMADTPAAWDDSENGSTLDALLLLAGVPLLLFVGIWVLAALPSMLGGQKYDPAVAFRDNPEWFGGPRQGTDAAPADASEPQGRGGTSANW